MSPVASRRMSASDPGQTLSLGRSFHIRGTGAKNALPPILFFEFIDTYDYVMILNCLSVSLVDRIETTEQIR